MRASTQILTVGLLLVAGSCVDQPVSPRARPGPPHPKLSVLSGAGSRIAYTKYNDGPPAIFVVNSDGTGDTRLTNTTSGDYAPNWSPDASRIAFVSVRDGNPEIYVMNADGSGQARVTNDPAVDEGPTWSPDGTRLAFYSSRDGNYEIYTMNIDGSGLTRLTDVPEADYFPDWGPDGRIVFSSGRAQDHYDIYVMNADGSGQTPLTTIAAYNSEPKWSPDGSRIAFVSAGPASANVYLMNADGSGLAQLTPASGRQASPDWSPDGARILFTANDGTTQHMYVANRDGSGVARVTTAVPGELYPDWEPVAAPRLPGQIAFSTDRDGALNFEIYLMNADGSSQAPVAVRTNFRDAEPEWSRDGQKIAFTSNVLPTYPSDVYTMNADGSNQRRLTNSIAAAGTEIYETNLEPSWSPDGTKIAFVSTRFDNSAEIFVMNADGSNPTRLTSSPVRQTSYNRFPRWSPDGQQILFTGFQDGDQEIYVMNADGSDQRRLTNHPGGDLNGHWSPDGRQIAFSRVEDGEQDIYVMNPDGSDPRRLTFAPTINIMPTWSPDGQYIAFASNRDPGTPGALHYDIYAIRSDGSGPTIRITSQGGVMWMPAWRPDGSAPPPNRGPVADAGADITAFRSTPTLASVSLDGTHSSDPDGDVLQLTWFEGATQIGSGATPTVDLALGSHNIELRVSDGRGGEASDNVVVNVVNRPPVVSTGGPYDGVEGTALSFAASAADADHDELTYGWNLGEGAAASGPAFPTSHTYADNGSYSARFTATDRFGGSDAKSITIAIANALPNVSIIGRSPSPVSGGVFRLSGGFSDLGINDSPWGWRINWGDGTPSTGTSLNQLDQIVGEHRYVRADTYRVELTVTDKDGGTGSAIATISVGRLIVALDALPFFGTTTRTVFYNVRKPILSEPVVIAILGSTDFAPVDPVTKRATINLASARLGGVPIATLPSPLPGALNGLYVAGPADVNRDGRLDLVLTFQTDRLVQAGALNPLLQTPQTLTLLGEHLDGRQFSGTQQIRVVTN